MIEALNDIILLEPIEEVEHTTEAGIILQQSSSKYVLSTVVSAGEDVKNLVVGDTVLFPKHTASEITVGTRKLLAIFKNQVVAKITKDAGN